MNEEKQRPRVGIPYRTVKEEVTDNLGKLSFYMDSVRDAGGEPVKISLRLSSGELKSEAELLDAIVLTGSPADVYPARYDAEPHPMCGWSDSRREYTDFALLEICLAHRKPVLAICYGVQSLNVYLGGTLIQHISSEDAASELTTDIPHAECEQKDKNFCHPVKFVAGSRIAEIAGVLEAKINSSHHQAIREAGRNLRIVGHAPDGVIEAVEWTGDGNWVTGVQWHPERMREDALAKALFRELVAAARGVAIRA